MTTLRLRQRDRNCGTAERRPWWGSGTGRPGIPERGVRRLVLEEAGSRINLQILVPLPVCV